MNDTYKLQKELLTKSNSILGLDTGRETASVEQYKKLSKLGFNKAVTKQKKLIDKYSLLKVIDRKAIDSICNKYNLIMGPVDNFIGEIPKKNAQQILDNAKYIQNKQKYTRDAYVTQKVSVSHYYDYTYDQSISIDDFVAEHGANQLLKLKNTGWKDFTYHAEEEITPDLTIKVIAPLHEFDTKGMKLKNNKLKKKKPKNEDPIVLAKLGKGLWAVLSAWGPESADANVFDAKNN